jgi:tRNA (guanine37-N1)-methyltransferase
VKVHVLTLFPRLFDNFLEESIVGIARAQGHLQVELTDYRSYATDRHHSVDDRPFGGGPGMVIKPEPVFAAVEDVLARSGRPEQPCILFTPQGRPFDQATAEWLAQEDEWLVLCGRYEGFDERIHEGFPWLELSLGPFVLSGGEVPAMAVIEAATRLVPGVLGDEESARQESFAPGADGLLDHPQYTRPRSFRGREVPPVLLNGNHDEIAAWRRDQAERRTAAWKSTRNPSR